MPSGQSGPCTPSPARECARGHPSPTPVRTHRPRGRSASPRAPVRTAAAPSGPSARPGVQLGGGTCTRVSVPGKPPEKLPREGVWQMLSQRGRRSDGQAWAAHTFRGAGRGQGRGHVGRRSEQSSTRGSSSSVGAAVHTNAAVPDVCLGTQRAALLGCHGGARLATGMVLRPWRAPPGGRPLPAGATRLSALCRPGTPCPGCGRWAAPHRAFFPGCRKDHTVWPARKCPTPASVRGDVKAEASRARERRHWRASKNFPVSCDAEIR